MEIEDEQTRLMRAEFLNALFEAENGRAATDTEDMHVWMMAKSKEEREIIRQKMEIYLQHKAQASE